MWPGRQIFLMMVWLREKDSRAQHVEAIHGLRSQESGFLILSP